MKCCTGTEVAIETSSCPSCGLEGRRIFEVTLKSLLRPLALERRSESTHRFCAEASCPVVYFGRTERFERPDLIVPVFQKESMPERLVCYCLGITEEEIRREAGAGRATSLERRIRDLVARDRCACELRNPQGSCCLGNVNRILRETRDDPRALKRPDAPRDRACPPTPRRLERPIRGEGPRSRPEEEAS